MGEAVCYVSEATWCQVTPSALTPRQGFFLFWRKYLQYMYLQRVTVVSRRTSVVAVVQLISPF